VPQLTVDHHLVFGPTECSDDFDGVSHPQGGGVDIGAFERSP
jgi:hypothetical protein